MKSLDQLVVIDTETSGTNPFVHEVLSIALYPLKEGAPPLEVHVKYSHINWTEYARRNFNQFKDKWQRVAIEPAPAVEEIERYLRVNFGNETVILVGHNVGFDISFLRKLSFLAGADMIDGISHRSIDTHSILYYLHLKNLGPKEFTTSDGAFKHFNISIPLKDRHTAIGDAIATEILFRKLLD